MGDSGEGVVPESAAVKLELFDAKKQNAAYCALFDDLVVTGLEFIPNSDVAALLKKCLHLSTSDVRLLKFKAQRFFKNQLKTSTNRGLGVDTFPLLMKTIACAQNPDQRWGTSITSIDMKKIDSMKLPLVQIQDVDVRGLLRQVTGGTRPASRRTTTSLNAMADAEGAQSGATGRGRGDSQIGKAGEVKEILDFTTMDRNPFQSVRNAELEMFRSIFRVLAHVVMVPAPVAERFNLPRTLAVVGAKSVAELMKTAGVNELSLRSIFTSTMAVFGCTGAWIQWPVFVTLLRMVSLAQQHSKDGGSFSRRQFTPIDVLESMPTQLNPPRLHCEVDQLGPEESAPKLDIETAMATLEQEKSECGDSTESESETESSFEAELADAWSLYTDAQAKIAQKTCSQKDGDEKGTSSGAEEHVQHLSAEEASFYHQLFNSAPSRTQGGAHDAAYDVVSASDVAGVLRSARLVTPQHLRVVFGTVAAAFSSDGRQFSYEMFVVAMRLTAYVQDVLGRGEDVDLNGNEFQNLVESTATSNLPTLQLEENASSTTVSLPASAVEAAGASSSTENATEARMPRLSADETKGYRAVFEAIAGNKEIVSSSNLFSVLRRVHDPVVPAATIRSIFKYVTQFRAAGAPATEVSWLQFATAMRLAAAYQAEGTDMDFGTENCQRICQKDEHRLLNFIEVGADPVQLAQKLRSDQQAVGSGTASHPGGSSAVGGMLAPASDDDSQTEDTSSESDSSEKETETEREARVRAEKRKQQKELQRRQREAQMAKRERRIRESQEAEAALERQVAEARAKAAAENALEDADAQSADPTAISESDTGSVQESPNEADDTPAVDQDAEIQLDTDEELAAMLEENTGSDGDGTDEQAQQPSDGGGRAGVADVPAKADTSAKSNPFKPKSKKKHRDDLAQKLYKSIRDVDLVQRYLVSRATLNWVNTADGDNTCLHRACTLGPKATVAKMLVDAKADIHATNAKGQTPLHCACQKGWVDIAKLLVEAKADINEPSAVNSKNGKDSGSPLDIAKRKANSVLLQRRRAAVVKTFDASEPEPLMGNPEDHAL